MAKSIEPTAEVYPPGEANEREWLAADGVGGYASSTAAGYNTRRYHGLWVSATRPPLGRVVILSQLETHLITPRADVYFSAARYAGPKPPANCITAKSFRSLPFPTWTFEAGGFELAVEVFLRRGGAGVVVSYEVKTDRTNWRLEIRPLLALRSFHHLRHEEGNLYAQLTDRNGFHIVSAQAGHMAAAPGVYIWADFGEARLAPSWYRNIYYRKEDERGFDHTEDLFVPGTFELQGSGEGKFHIYCSTSAPTAIDAEAEREAEIARRGKIIESAGLGIEADDRIAALVGSADAFIVSREVSGRPSATVIAGYHWFGDWGRDTMIALPGLTLATGRFEAARQILETFVSAAGEGMIPNNFSEETGEPQFNSVDASLWFIQAARAYLQAAADADFVRERLWPVIVAIVEAYARGTRFGIGADSDGLITAGDENTQLTWMDAKSGGRPVTPRHGKAVEVNALWVSGLRIVAQIACELKRNPPAVCSSADAVAAAFEEAFWNEAKGCLYDCIGPDGKADDAVRPNQILAVSLPCAPLSGARAAGVVRVVREKLYTPFGLRTLAPDEPGYSARYEGGPDERDAAYHQGTVWPWLLGPFIEACLKVGGFSDKVRAECREMLAAVLENLDAAGLGSISEIFDAEPPHIPRGCIAQAWSVAEVLRAWKLLQTGPA